MTDVEYRNSLYELSEIFKILDKDLIAKIPEKIKNIIENEKSTNYSFDLDYSKRLSEQRLSETTELFLTTLYLKYWCNEEEKQHIVNAMRENEKIYQEELRQQYNSDNLFKYNSVESENVQEQATTQQVQMIEHKETNILKKIINKIKNILKKKENF